MHFKNVKEVNVYKTAETKTNKLKNKQLFGGTIRYRNTIGKHDKGFLYET